ncbi:MAG: helix-turn-helix domain-containing protein [Xanthobacteraceae bacterium]
MRHNDRHQLAGPAAFTVEEAADYLRLSRAGIWRLLKDGRLPRARIGGRTLIRRVDVDAFLERCVEAA